MKIPNPNTNQPFERVQGEYGYRTVDGNEEVVHLPTQQSNMNYYTPEMVMDASNCEHEYKVLSMGKREVECLKCNHGLTFHINQLSEKKGQLTLTIKRQKYALTL